jgi:hypothetical protein
MMAGWLAGWFGRLLGGWRAGFGCVLGARLRQTQHPSAISH